MFIWYHKDIINFEAIYLIYLTDKNQNGTIEFSIVKVNSKIRTKISKILKSSVVFKHKREFK